MVSEIKNIRADFFSNANKILVKDNKTLSFPTLHNILEEK